MPKSQFIFITCTLHLPKTLKDWVGVQRGNLTSWGEDASLALVGHPYSDGVTIRIPYGVDVLLHLRWLKLNLALLLD